MKMTLKYLTIFSLLMVLLLPTFAAHAQPVQQIITGDKLVLGGTFALENGETLDGNLFIFGGNVNLNTGSTVAGDVAMVGGNLNADGRITGNVISLGGVVQMSESTTVDGDVNVLGGNLQGEGQATISGNVTSDTSTSLPVIVPGGFRLPVPNINLSFNPLWDFLWLLFQSFMWAALAVLVALFAPNPTRRVAGAVTSQPVASGGLGLLTVIVAPLALLVVSLTIIGIPVALLAILAIVTAWAFGTIAIGMEVGERLAKMGKADWALAVSAALGTFILTLIVHGIGKLVPCIGWLLPFLVGVIGLGAVLLTRFGSQSYPIESAAPITTAPAEVMPVTTATAPVEHPESPVQPPTDNP